jgi:hypothetical protein
MAATARPCPGYILTPENHSEPKNTRPLAGPSKVNPRPVSAVIRSVHEILHVMYKKSPLRCKVYRGVPVPERVARGRQDTLDLPPTAL